MAANCRELESLIEQAIERKVASSISLWIGNADGALMSAHAGAALPETIYDLASLTKILGTTLALAHACADGALSLDERPFAAWPALSVRDLMAHKSGLLAHRHFYREPGVKIGLWPSNIRIMMKALYEEKPYCAPGCDRLYSDLNFLALGELLEKRRKKNLMAIFEDAWRKACLKKPLHSYASGVQRDERLVAPTGWCSTRNENICAQVHDLNCYFIGGLAGHAGLFGTLIDTASLGQFFLRCYRTPSNAFECLLKSFMQRRIGFDHPTIMGSVRCLSPQSFGHFGFTGVSLWIDPRIDPQGRIYVLLTNRVALSAKPEGIFWLREKLHRLASS